MTNSNWYKTHKFHSSSYFVVALYYIHSVFATIHLFNEVPPGLPALSLSGKALELGSSIKSEKGIYLPLHFIAIMHFGILNVSSEVNYSCVLFGMVAGALT